jgi:hypothetical protein
LNESAPKEEAISERSIFVKCSSIAPIICFETSNALEIRFYFIRRSMECTRLESVVLGVRVVVLGGGLKGRVRRGPFERGLQRDP